jgi:hypothetical protein
VPSRARFAPDVVIQWSGDEAVLLKLTDETVFALNSTGARIAALINEGADLAHIVEQLGAEYQLPVGAVEDDVRELLDVLLAKGLIEVETANDPA